MLLIIWLVRQKLYAKTKPSQEKLSANTRHILVMIWLQSSNSPLLTESSISLMTSIFSIATRLKKVKLSSSTQLNLCGFLFPNFLHNKTKASSSCDFSFFESKSLLSFSKHACIFSIKTKISPRSRLNSSSSSRIKINPLLLRL